MKTLMKYFKGVNGQSLAEFAVTTAMMATLATTAAPNSLVLVRALRKRRLWQTLIRS